LVGRAARQARGHPGNRRRASLSVRSASGAPVRALERQVTSRITGVGGQQFVQPARGPQPRRVHRAEARFSTVAWEIGRRARSVWQRDAILKGIRSFNGGNFTDDPVVLGHVPQILMLCMAS